MRLRFGLLCLILLASTSAFAQDFRGGVNGTVKDGSGGVLPGVTITVTNIETNVSVTARAPILDTSTGVTGQVIDSNQIQRLPLGDGTAYMLTRLAPGLSDSSDLHFSRPMDNGNLAGITVNGALGGNEFTLDGAPNRVSPNNTLSGNNSGVVGFSPPSDAISEFKVVTNAFDSSVGHTAGAT